MRLAPLLLVAAAGCSFQGGLPSGLQCAEDERCPSGQMCVDGFCSAEVPDAEPGAIDAGPDAGTLSARCGTLDLLSDDFGDGQRGELWYQWADPGATPGEIIGYLTIAVPQGTQTGWAGYSSRYAFDLRGAALHADVDLVGGHYTTLEIRGHDGSRVQMIAEDGMLLAAVYGTADDGVRVTIPYVASAHRHWRIREADGTITWEHSPNGTAWTELHAEPAPIPLEHVIGTLSGGGQLATMPSMIRFDEVNLDVPESLGFCPATQLQDDFAEAPLDPLWEHWDDTDCTTTEAGGNLQLTFGGAAGSFCGIASRHLYDLEGSAVVLDAGATPEAPSFVTYFQVGVPDGSETYVEIAHNENELQIAKVVDGTNLQGTNEPYDPIAHRYWRIRAEGTDVHVEVSPDNATWTTKMTSPAAIVTTRVRVIVGAGRYGTVDGAPVTVTLAGINP